MRGGATAVGLALALAFGSDRARAAERGVLRDAGCGSCHLEGRAGPYVFADFGTFKRSRLEPTSCARCHVNNALATSPRRPAGWLPLSDHNVARIRAAHPYVQMPPLVFEVRWSGARPDRTIARFTDCGLSAFLAAPMPRRTPAIQSMYPMTVERRRRLVAELRPQLEPCGDRRPPSPAQVERGRASWHANGCGSCHGQRPEAPALRIGLPLLGKAYFQTLLARGTASRRPVHLFSRRWVVEGGEIVAAGASPEMPAYPHLPREEVDALYAYVAHDRSDLPPERRSQTETTARRQADAPGPPSGLDLFRSVQREVFDGSCRHCHAPGAPAQISVRLFGRDPAGARPLPLPTTRGGFRPDDRTRAAFSPGPGCSASPLVARLRTRVREWHGDHLPARAPRGMPLTVPPLPESVIARVELWTRLGCPTESGSICTSCRHEAQGRRPARRGTR